MVFGVKKYWNGWHDGFRKGQQYGIEQGETKARSDLDNLLKIRNNLINDQFHNTDKLTAVVDKRIEEWLKPTVSAATKP